MNFKKYYLLKESFGFDYKFPKDSNEAIADFYALSLVRNPENLRDEDLAYSFKIAIEENLKGMKQMLLEAVLRACSCEIFHFQGFWKFDLYEYFTRKNPQFKNNKLFNDIQEGINYEFMKMYYKDDLINYDERWEIIKNTINSNVEEFLNMCKVLFVQGDSFWHHKNYGGEAWGKIAEAGLKLIETKGNSLYVIIDHIIDIEHNSGSIFSKWPRNEVSKNLLTFKRNMTPDKYVDLIPDCSLQIQRGLRIAIKELYNYTFEGRQKSKEEEKKKFREESIEYFIKVYNLTLNPDGSYDTSRDIRLTRGIVEDGKLLIKFKKVNGDFNCELAKLKTLEGCPEIVGGDYNCYINHLTDLQGAPEVIHGDFECAGNDLITLEGGPKKVSGDFNCTNNNLKNLKGSPEIIGGKFICNNNELISLEGCPKEVGGNFICIGQMHSNFTEQDIRKICKVSGKVVLSLDGFK